MNCVAEAQQQVQPPLGAADRQGAAYLKAALVADGFVHRDVRPSNVVVAGELLKIPGAR